MTSKHIFAVCKFDREPSAAAVRRCEKDIRQVDPDVQLITAGYPATNCRFQAWCVVDELGTAANHYRGEVEKRFVSLIREHLG